MPAFKWALTPFNKRPAFVFNVHAPQHFWAPPDGIFSFVLINQPALAKQMAARANASNESFDNEPLHLPIRSRRPASESGSLRHADGARGRGDRCRTPWSSRKPGPIPRFPLHSRIDSQVNFPPIDVSGRALGQDEVDAAIQTTSTAKVRRVDFGGCGPLQPLTPRGWRT